jgi:hypothetical protein
MRWDAVLQAVSTRAKEDEVLAGIYGADFIRKMGIKVFRVPSLEYMLVGATQGELWAPHMVQWSQWNATMEEQAISDRRLHRLFDHDIPVFIGGVYMWAVWEDSSDLTGPEREGYYGLASRFTFTPIREKLLAGRG